MSKADIIWLATMLSPIVIVPAIYFFRKWLIEKGPCLHLRPYAKSAVEDHEGLCAMTWNGAWSFSRFDRGYTGFFRNVRRIGPVWVSYGPEFHGIRKFGTDGSTVTSTKTRDPYDNEW